MNATDLIVSAGALIVMAGVLVAAKIMELRDEIARQRKRAEVAEMWAGEYQDEACRLQQEVASLERQRDNLRMLYVTMVRDRLAASAPVVEYYAARRKAK